MIDFISTILAFGLLHSISKRNTARVYCDDYDQHSADSWLIYFIIFFSVLVLSFQLVATAALATQSNFVNIVTVTGFLLLLWGADRWLFKSVTPQCTRLSYGKVLIQAYTAVRSTDKFVRWSVAAAIGVALIFILEAVTRPPDGWDALVYHLPLSAKWFQQGSLAFIEESWKFQMPSNGNIFPLFLMYLGNEHVLSLTSLPYALIAMLSIYSLAQQLSASREEAIIAAIGFGTMPIFFYHAFTIMVDIFAAAFFLSSICLLLKLFQQQTFSNEKRQSLALVAGLAFGLCFGARITYAPLLLCMTGFCILVAIHGSSPPRAGKWKHIFLTVIYFDFGSLLTSTFWYVRNLLAVDNPMHPVKLSLSDSGINVSTSALSERPQGMPNDEAIAQTCLIADDKNIQHWFFAPWQDCWAAGDAHYSTNSGFGAVFATFVPVMVIAIIILIALSTIRRKQLQPVHLLLLIAVVFLTYWWTYLFNMIRAIFPVLAIFFLFTAVVIGNLSHQAKRSIYFLFLIAMVTNAILLAANPVQALSSRLLHNTWSHSSFYRVPAIIDELPSGSVILNASHEKKNYPLYGSHWQNQVITDRALLEPKRVSVIGNEFIEKKNIEYIFYDTRSKWTLADDVKHEVLYERPIDEATPDNKYFLYRIIR